MFTETRRPTWRIFSLGSLFCLMGFLFAMPCLAQNAPKGEAIIAIDEGFALTGGDYHTGQMGGAANICYLIHEGLVRKTPDGRIVPALARSWEIAKDGMSIKFTLNERAKFHNGEPVTAQDVKFSYERAMRPEMKYFRGGELRRNIEKVEVTDDRHLTIYFKKPFPGFFEVSGAQFAIIPKAYTEKVGDAEYAKHPIGAGPFKWIDYQQDVFVKAEAVSDHYRQIPSVKKLHLKFRVDPATLMAMLKSGEADIIKVPFSNISEVKSDPKLQIVWSKNTYTEVLMYFDLAFPNEPSPFHDIGVRKAASYAINRKAICEKLIHGAAEPYADIYSPNHLGFDPTLKPTSYDPEKARALLKEAGYPNGFDTTFNYGMLGDKVEAQAMAADLARVGIRAKLVEFEYGTFISNVREKKFRGVARFGHSTYNGMTQPAVTLEPLSADSIWSYYSTPEFEAALKKLSVLYDEKAIAAQAREVSRIYREPEIRSIVWTKHQPFGLSERVKSYKPIPGWIFVGGLEYLELK
jgi:peptide/nickel transport system substrate-binding protein